MKERCVNCGTNHCNTIGRRTLDNEIILSVIRQGLAPKYVDSSDHVCQACWDLAQSPNVDVERLLGHRNVCVHCGRSLESRVRHLLHMNSTRESSIYKVIEEWISPEPIHKETYICHTCWVRAARAVVRLSDTSSQPDKPEETNQEPTIVLPEYMRPVATEIKCFVKGCKRKERNRIPVDTRKMLLNQYKYYVPENNRLCDKHSVIESCDFVDSLRTHCTRSFTAKQIQDMMSLK